MGWLGVDCVGVSWAKHEQSSAMKRPQLALEGYEASHTIFGTGSTHQARFQPKRGKNEEFLFFVEHEPGVQQPVRNSVVATHGPREQC